MIRVLSKDGAHFLKSPPFLFPRFYIRAVFTVEDLEQIVWAGGTGRDIKMPLI